uniref:Peptidase S1 domain-containing protein n=1 Tax=Lates calcarifer TaxID=8187 RepID=A0A4W6CWS4_LATCA
MRFRGLSLSGVTMTTALDLQKRIIGGQRCSDDERHYHVKLMMWNHNYERSFCGGSLISQHWILTAAHCLVVIYAVLNVHPCPRELVQIKEPPKIYRDSSGRDHDLMLLKLPKPAGIQSNDLPILPNEEVYIFCAFVGVIIFLCTGFCSKHFLFSSDCFESPTLQCANIKVVDCNPLLTSLKNDPIYYTSKHQNIFCGWADKVDTCPGDSGGGVVDQHKKIHGVISFGDFVIPSSIPNAFMKLCKKEYLDWIKKEAKDP